MCTKQVGVLVKWNSASLPLRHAFMSFVQISLTAWVETNHSSGFGYIQSERLSQHIICQIMGSLGSDIFTLSLYCNVSWMRLNACVSHYLPALADLWGVRDYHSKGGGNATAVWLRVMMLVFLSSFNFCLDVTFTENPRGMRVLYCWLHSQANYSHFLIWNQHFPA